VSPIAKGEPWGAPGALPPDGVMVDSDATAAEALEAARLARRPFPVVGLTGGDLCRTLGGGRGGDLRMEGTRFDVDVGEVLLDGRLRLFVAHVVVRTHLWGEGVAVMQAQWRGAMQLAPRAHPGDGLLDVFQWRLSPMARMSVRARAHHGAHLPHPAISAHRVGAYEADVGGRRVWLDGRPAGRAQRLFVRLLPAALTVVV
jgi:hypothetical protein